MNILNEEETKNLEVIFQLARQASINNKPQLIGVLNFEELLNKKLNPSEVKAEEEKSK